MRCWCPHYRYERLCDVQQFTFWPLSRADSGRHRIPPTPLRILAIIVLQGGRVQGRDQNKSSRLIHYNIINLKFRRKDPVGKNWDLKIPPLLLIPHITSLNCTFVTVEVHICICQGPRTGEGVRSWGPHYRSERLCDLQQFTFGGL